MNAKIIRLDKNLPLPEYHTPGACAFDFCAREDTDIDPSEVKLIKTGLIIEVPADFSLLVLPRSSLPFKRGLMIPNSPGLIDCDYCGPTDEIRVQVLNFTQEKVSIKRGERIAQGLFVKTENANFTEVTKISKNSRGGFGTTGK